MLDSLHFCVTSVWASDTREQIYDIRSGGDEL